MISYPVSQSRPVRTYWGKVGHRAGLPRSRASSLPSFCRAKIYTLKSGFGRECGAGLGRLACSSLATRIASWVYFRASIPAALTDAVLNR